MSEVRGKGSPVAQCNSYTFLYTSRVLKCDRFLLLDFLTTEDGTDRLSRNVGKELPLYSAQ